MIATSPRTGFGDGSDADLLIYTFSDAFSANPVQRFAHCALHAFHPAQQTVVLVIEHMTGAQRRGARYPNNFNLTKYLPGAVQRTEVVIGLESRRKRSLVINGPGPKQGKLQAAIGD